MGPDIALLRVDGHAATGLFGALDLHADEAIDSRVLEGGQHLLGDVFILERHQSIEAFEERDLDAELAVERRELDPDSAGADDADRLRNLRRERGVVGRNDQLAVELEAWQRADG